MEKPAHVSLASIYRVFFEIGLFSFGGAVSGWIQREVVDIRRWMTLEDFLSGIAMTQIMPGPNATNAAVYVGQQLRGVRGAVTALVAMLTAPFIAIVLAGMTYRLLLAVPGFQAAMAGTAAAAVGILLRTAIRSAWITGRGLMPATITAIIVVAIGVLRLPLLLVIAIVAPLSVAAAFWSDARSTGHE